MICSRNFPLCTFLKVDTFLYILILILLSKKLEPSLHLIFYWSSDGSLKRRCEQSPWFSTPRTNELSKEGVKVGVRTVTKDSMGPTLGPSCDRPEVCDQPDHGTYRHKFLSLFQDFMSGKEQNLINGARFSKFLDSGICDAFIYIYIDFEFGEHPIDVTSELIGKTKAVYTWLGRDIFNAYK